MKEAYCISPATKIQGTWPWTISFPEEEYDQAVRWPRISIVTPSLNQGNFLEQTIRSVLLQHYPNLEYIIIDGGSTDNTISLLKKYEEKLNFWISEKDSGQSEALNKGFSRASGEIIAWINSDDFYEKGAFQKVALRYIETGFSFLCGSCLMIDEQGNSIQELRTKEISEKSLLRYWKPHFCPPQPSIFFKRSVFEELGRFSEGLKYAMDYDLWLRATQQFAFVSISDRLSYYRVHSLSKTGSPGGLQKFIPEWKQLIRINLKSAPFLRKWDYHLSLSLHTARTLVTRLFSRQALKNAISIWIK